MRNHAAGAARVARLPATEARSLEAAALLLAGLAALTYAGRSGLSARLLLPGIVTLLAFGAWAIVQLDPSIADAALVTDAAIVLFILDLALICGGANHFRARLTRESGARARYRRESRRSSVRRRVTRLRAQTGLSASRTSSRS